MALHKRAHERADGTRYILSSFCFADSICSLTVFRNRKLIILDRINFLNVFFEVFLSFVERLRLGFDRSVPTQSCLGAGFVVENLIELPYSNVCDPDHAVLICFVFFFFFFFLFFWGILASGSAVLPVIIYHLHKITVSVAICITQQGRDVLSWL